MRIEVKLDGIKDVLARIGAIETDIEPQIDEAVERTALQMVNTSRGLAPVDTSLLRNSIDIIPQETKPMQRTWGTNVEYALRQEFEHKTKSGYVRNAVRMHELTFREELTKAINRTIGG